MKRYKKQKRKDRVELTMESHDSPLHGHLQCSWTLIMALRHSWLNDLNRSTDAPSWAPHKSNVLNLRSQRGQQLKT